MGPPALSAPAGARGTVPHRIPAGTPLDSASVQPSGVCRRAAAGAPSRRRHRLGLLLVFVSALAWSTAGLFTRLIPVDPWTMMYWRGLFGGLFIAVFVVWQSRCNTLRILRTMGWGGWFVAICATIGMIPFVPALKLTTVANVMIIYATVPFAAAVLARVWLRERVAPPTLAASAAAFVGVVVMAGGLSGPRNHWGEILALAMMLGTALTTVAIRRYHAAPLLPVAAVSGFLGAAAIWPFAAPFSVDLKQMAWLALFGFVQMGLGLALFSIGSRLMTAARTGLTIALEMPLAPLWVWLAFGERPETSAIAGGAIVLTAVIGHLFADRPRRLGGRRAADTRRKSGSLDAELEGSRPRRQSLP